MTFGQQPGPPATARQVQELLGLVQEAGYTDLRDARGPLGLTQRQAGGRFTRDEAAALIERLQDPEADVDRPSPERLSAAEQAVRGMPSEQLAAELQRRGWVVLEP